MTRPCCVSPPGWKPPERNDLTTLEVQLKVVTPMFGGGYEPRETDPDVPIRAAAIRGHLRFWWRATAGARYSSPEELFEAEAALWGSAAGQKDESPIGGPGEVQVRVSVLAPEKGAGPIRLDRADVPDYVRAFLIQEKPETEKVIREKFRHDKQRMREELDESAKQIEKEKDVLYPFVLPRSRFVLHVHMASAAGWGEVATALKAFLLFGGVGGRTRRGYGCLDCDVPPPELNEVSLGADPAWFSTGVAAPTGITSLCGARLFVGAGVGTPSAAWKTASEMLQHFRKAEVPGCHRPDTGLGSHTTWPEADMLRQIKQPPAPTHNPCFAGKGGIPSFPRAQMGMPLKFQSQKSHAGAFGECEISLAAGSQNTPRLASPVIVKPIKLGGQWHPAMVILESTGIAPGQLRLSSNPPARPTADCSGAPAGLWDGKANVPFSHSHSSVLDVLASYLLVQAHWTQMGVNSL